MTKASQVFKRGDFTTANYYLDLEGAYTIRLVDRKGRVGQFKVKNLYESNERVLEDEDMKGGGE